MLPTFRPNSTAPAEAEAPRLEGSIRVDGRRRLGFAEFGVPDGSTVLWLHGTPGARRQIPLEARRFATANGMRIVGLDRPGIGSSTPHQYGSVLEFTRDLEIVLDRLGVDRLGVVGLSGGGPYTLAAAVALQDRVPAVAVLGGVPPLTGPDAVEGGLLGLGARLSPVIRHGRVPLTVALSAAIRAAHPLANPAISLYARLSPDGDRRLLNEPDFKAMFLDDLLQGSRKQLGAPLSDLVLFTRDWGFDLSEVTQPVLWWHGDADHIIPHDHGAHVAARLPNAPFVTLPGAAHLGGLGVAVDVLEQLGTHLG